MHQRDAEEEWRRLARRAVRKVNAGWWLEAFAPLAIGAGLVGFCVIFLLRSKWVEIDPALSAGAGVGALLVIAVSAWAIVRGRFRKVEEGFVMLDARMKLRNALTTACRGHGPWPDLPLEPRDGLHWRWQWLLAPILFPAACLAAAFMIPVSLPKDDEVRFVVKPPALAQIENAIETLEEEKIIDEEDLGKIREALESLRQLPADEWYSHNNLEALDSMRDTLAANLHQLESELGKVDGALAAFEKFRESLPRAAKDRLQRKFEEALRGMSGGGMRANKALREALSKIDPSKLGSLNQDQLKKLRETLAKNRGACQSCLGNGQGPLSPDEEALRDLLAEGPDPNGSGTSNDAMPGSGGVNRGPGHAPTRLGDESDLGTKNLEGVENDDLSRSTLGTVLSEREIEREIDQSKVGPRAGGEIKSAGAGGEAVWTNELLPEERETLRRFFE